MEGETLTVPTLHEAGSARAVRNLNVPQGVRQARGQLERKSTLEARSSTKSDARTSSRSYITAQGVHREARKSTEAARQRQNGAAEAERQQKTAACPAEEAGTLSAAGWVLMVRFATKCVFVHAPETFTSKPLPRQSVGHTKSGTFVKMHANLSTVVTRTAQAWLISSRLRRQLLSMASL